VRSEFPALDTAEWSVWEIAVCLPHRPHDEQCRDVTSDGYQATVDIYVEIDECCNDIKIIKFESYYTALVF